MIEQLRGLGSIEATQRVTGSEDGICIRFRGPHPLGDFLVEEKPQRIQIQLRLLSILDSYIAVMPGDLLAVDEVCLAR